MKYLLLVTVLSASTLIGMAQTSSQIPASSESDTNNIEEAAFPKSADDIRRHADSVDNAHKMSKREAKMVRGEGKHQYDHGKRSSASAKKEED